LHWVDRKVDSTFKPYQIGENKNENYILTTPNRIDLASCTWKKYNIGFLKLNLISERPYFTQMIDFVSAIFSQKIYTANIEY
jgi:hypothetical protein